MLSNIWVNSKQSESVRGSHNQFSNCCFFATLSVARKKGLIGQCYSVTIFLDDLLLYDLFCIFFTLHNPYPANRISINPMLSRPLKRILNGNMRICGSWLDDITWCMDFDLYRQICNLRIQREKKTKYSLESSLRAMYLHLILVEWFLASFLLSLVGDVFP